MMIQSKSMIKFEDVRNDTETLSLILQYYAPNKLKLSLQSCSKKTISLQSCSKKTDKKTVNHFNIF